MKENVKSTEKIDVKKLNVKKLKFVKEIGIRYEVQSGGCNSCGGCTHWC